MCGHHARTRTGCPDCTVGRSCRRRSGCRRTGTVWSAATTAPRRGKSGRRHQPHWGCHHRLRSNRTGRHGAQPTGQTRCAPPGSTHRGAPKRAYQVQQASTRAGKQVRKCDLSNHPPPPLPSRRCGTMVHAHTHTRAHAHAHAASARATTTVVLAVNATTRTHPSRGATIGWGIFMGDSGASGMSRDGAGGKDVRRAEREQHSHTCRATAASCHLPRLLVAGPNKAANTRTKTSPP